MADLWRSLALDPPCMAPIGPAGSRARAGRSGMVAPPAIGAARSGLGPQAACGPDCESRGSPGLSAFRSGRGSRARMNRSTRRRARNPCWKRSGGFGAGHCVRLRPASPDIQPSPGLHACARPCCRTTPRSGRAKTQCGHRPFETPMKPKNSKHRTGCGFRYDALGCQATRQTAPLTT